MIHVAKWIMVMHDPSQDIKKAKDTKLQAQKAIVQPHLKIKINGALYNILVKISYDHLMLFQHHQE